MSTFLRTAGCARDERAVTAIAPMPAIRPRACLRLTCFCSVIRLPPLVGREVAGSATDAGSEAKWARSQVRSCLHRPGRQATDPTPLDHQEQTRPRDELGRASWRDRVCPYV